MRLMPALLLTGCLSGPPGVSESCDPPPSLCDWAYWYNRLSPVMETCEVAWPWGYDAYPWGEGAELSVGTTTAIASPVWSLRRNYPHLDGHGVLAIMANGSCIFTECINP